MQNIMKMPAEIMHKAYRFSWRCLQRARFDDKRICIISQNCIGGVIYHDLGLEFTSSFINCLVRGADMMRLCSDPERYMSAVPVIERYDESPAYPRHPVIRVDDVEEHFPHTDSGDRALAAWERRVNRIHDYDDLEKVIIATSWDLDENPALIDALRSLPLKKVVFTDKPDLAGEDSMSIPDRLIVRNEERTPNVLAGAADRPWQQVFERCFDFVKWLNGAPVRECRLV